MSNGDLYGMGSGPLLEKYPEFLSKDVNYIEPNNTGVENKELMGYWSWQKWGPGGVSGSTGYLVELDESGVPKSRA
jgi:hypothetical protein